MANKSISNDDYQGLKTFLDRYFEWYAPKYPTTPPGGPSRFLEQLEKTSLANAKKGLCMALNDIAEESAHWTTDKIAIADARFLASGTFTLSEIRRRYSKKYLQILQRGVIRSEIEYYLIKGMRDGGSIEPSTTEGQQVEVMLLEFEEKNK